MNTFINKLRMLGADEITVRAPFITHSFELETEYLLSLDVERLLAGFRETAGLPTAAKRYGGWESTEIQGHTLGHYLTAMAQAWAASKDSQIMAKITEAIEGLRSCQRADGYLFASPEELFDKVERKEPVWVPWYTMHKIVAGLVSVCNLTDCAAARDVLRRLADWIADRALGWSEEMRLTVISVEYGSMNGCMYDVYRITGDERHMLAAHQFDETALLEPISEGKDILNGLHANTTIPKILGALKRYALVGDAEPLYLRAAEAFWDMVISHHTYISGGNSEWEHFGLPDILDAERTACNCETCNTHNMIKLSDLLFSLTGKKKYADYSSWAFVNTILSSQNHETGMTTYFQPMDSGFFKVYSRPYDQFWCCTGTGMENFTKPWEGIAFAAEDRIYINRYLSADIACDDISLSVDCDWLSKDTAEIKINACPSGKSIAMRIPCWAEDYELTLPSGIGSAEENGYIILNGGWEEGMIISLRFGMALRRHSLPDSSTAAAFSYGPFMLSADMGTERLETDVTGVDVTVPTRKMAVRDYLIDPQITAGDRPAEFTLRSADGFELQLAPHFLKNQVRYGIYLRCFEGESKALADYLAELDRMSDIMGRQSDIIPIGNDQYELAHAVRGEKTDPFADGTDRGRVIYPSGCVSYELNIPSQPCVIRLEFSGEARIELDGELLEAAPQMKIPESILSRKVRIKISNLSEKENLTLRGEMYIEETAN